MSTLSEQVNYAESFDRVRRDGFVFVGSEDRAPYCGDGGSLLWFCRDGEMYRTPLGRDGLFGAMRWQGSDDWFARWYRVGGDMTVTAR